MKPFIILITLISFIIGYAMNIEELLPLFALWLIIYIVYYGRSLCDSNILYRNWFCPSYILLFGLLIVCFQTPLNIFLEKASFTAYMPVRYERYLVQCSYLGLLSVAAYISGGLVNPNCSIPPSHKKTKYVLWPWLVLLPVMLGLFVININIANFLSGSDYIGSGGYNRSANLSSYFEQLLDVNIIIVTSLITFRQINKCEVLSFKKFLGSFPAIYWIVVAVYLILRLLSGDRGPVLYALCLIFYSYLMCTKHRFKLATVLILILVAAIATTLIGITRTGNLDQSFIDRLESAIQEDNISKPSILPPTQELANSINTEFIAVDAINNSGQSYNYGKYTFYALISSIPGSSYILSNLFDVDMRSTMSSEYITIYDKGYRYSYGLGTSPMAEFYLEFGAFGCMLGLFFLGWLFSYVNQVILGNNRNISIYIIIFSLKLASVAIYIPRSSVGTCMAKAFYIVIIFWVLNKLFNVFRVKAKSM